MEKFISKDYEEDEDGDDEEEEDEDESEDDSLDLTKNPYNCQVNSFECGNYDRYRKVGCVTLKDLQENVGPIFGADIEITECELICLRAATHLNTEDLICFNHIFTLGKAFRPSTKCKYFKHPVNSKAKGIKLSWHLYTFVKTLDPKFILGSMICKACQMKLNELMKEESMEWNRSDNDSDPDFVNPTPIIDEKDKLKKREQLDSLTTALGMDRVRYQIRSNIKDMAPTSLNYFSRLYKQMQTKLTDTFCNLIAPGQEAEMKKLLISEQEKQIQDESVLLHLKEAYDTCSTATARRSVLMLVPKTYSKQKVSDFFNCSLYEVRKAREILKLHGACGVECENKRTYSRLSFEKACHFIDFLFSSGLLQEMAYGATKLRFESGDKIAVSNTILNGVYENAVCEYKIYCQEINYDALGRTTLLKMLSKINPHIRKKLAGVDMFIVQGIEAFERMRQCLKMVENNAETERLLKSIIQSENYLKARYKMHCNSNDSCITHCIEHALSHPNDRDLLSKCERLHDHNCSECQNIINAIENWLGIS